MTEPVTFADPISPDEFMATAAKSSPSGSSAWASTYAIELKRVFLDHAARAPRTLQQHLGPSELGVSCDRQVIGKMAALPATNHVNDPWPSIVGTACHAWAEEAFTADNVRRGVLRWLAEQKVAPHPDHPGTADLYDAQEQAVVDHKFLGATSMNKVRKAPPRKYRRQLLLYGLGYLRLGLPVRRVALAAYPRTAASLDGLYVWELEITADGMTLLPEILAELDDTFAETARRRAIADQVIAGQLRFIDTPKDPDGDECYYCPFYRPQVDQDEGSWCAGAGRVR